MKKVLLAVVVAAAAAGCSRSAPTAQSASANAPSTADPSAARVERGAYLVNMIGCNDCHTPFTMGPNGPEPDMTRALIGHPEQIGTLPPLQPQGSWLWAGTATNTAFSGPWGVSYAANLTPDQNTGLGIWTEEMFVNAIRTGKHMGVSRPILPPMPWPAFRNATDDDLKAIYAYLRSLKPIHNRVPDPLIAPPPVPTN